jgi:hypothetical protein
MSRNIPSIGKSWGAYYALQDTFVSREYFLQKTDFTEIFVLSQRTFAPSDEIAILEITRDSKKKKSSKLSSKPITGKTDHLKDLS